MISPKRALSGHHGVSARQPRALGRESAGCSQPVRDR